VRPELERTDVLWGALRRFWGTLRHWAVACAGPKGWRRDYCALLALSAFHVLINWAYLRARVTILWVDWPSHLRTTLTYSAILRNVNLHTLFEVLSRTWYRPPLPWLPAVPLYRLFGESEDVAVMGNCVFLVILILSVYGVGKRVYGAKVGLLSAFLVSMTPILFNQSRLPYPDYPLAAMVALSVNWLVRVEGFRHRGYSLLLGLSFGLGMLTKQSFVVFVVPPLAYVVVKSGIIRGPRAGLMASRQSRTSLSRLRDSPVAHILVALVTTLVWYVPNRDYVGRFYLGHSLFFCYWVLVGTTFYVLSRRPSRGTNSLSAALIAVTVAAVWYLPNILSLRHVLATGYTGISLGERTLSFSEPYTYVRYLDVMAREQLGPLLFGTLAVSVFLLGHRWMRTLRRPLDHGGMVEGGRIVGLWLLIPLLLFTFSLTMNIRFTVPALPAAAIVTAAGWGTVSNRLVSRGLVLLLVMGGMVQFLALSFDELLWVREIATLQIPRVGEVNLLSHGGNILLPSSGATDSRYFVLPDLLEAVRTDMLAHGRANARVGLLTDTQYLNRVTFGYVASAEGYPEIALTSLAAQRDGPPLYDRVFGSDYVVLRRTSAEPTDERGRISFTLAHEPPALFREVFSLLEEYPVPDGDVFLLYGKRVRAGAVYDEEAYREVGEAVARLVGRRDAIILDPYEQIEVLGRYYLGQAQPYSLEGAGVSDEAGLARRLKEVTSEHPRIIAVFWSPRQSKWRPFVESWLNEAYYRALSDWYDGVEVVVYETSRREGECGAFCAFDVSLGRGISLVQAGIVDGLARPGDIVRVFLHWRAAKAIHEDYKVFVHLLDAGDNVVAQGDSVPAGGARPTTGWEVGELVIDKHGLLLRKDLPNGTYRLIGGMYLPTTGERLRIVDGNGHVVGSQILLGTVRVEG
jgi:hypothetical protein